MRQPTLTASAQLLADLPDFDPPADLWPRILRRQRVLQLRRRAALGTLLAAASVVLALVLRIPVPVSGDPALVRLQADSQRLESRLAMLVGGFKGSANESPTDLRPVERALQDAYDRGASSAELAELWRRRNEMLDALISTRETGTLVTRI
ncbi:MAG: hypothetical protein ABI411_19280 [Tahibacter sp.]